MVFLLNLVGKELADVPSSTQKINIYEYRYNYSYVQLPSTTTPLTHTDTHTHQNNLKRSSSHLSVTKKRRKCTVFVVLVIGQCHCHCQHCVSALSVLSRVSDGPNVSGLILHSVYVSHQEFSSIRRNVPFLVFSVIVRVTVVT